MIETLVIEGLGPFKKNREFTFKPGINVILGKNCSGKSTLVWILNCLMNGDVRWHELGCNFREERKGVAEVRHSGGRATLNLFMGYKRRDMKYKSSGSVGSYMFSGYGDFDDAKRIAKEVIETVLEKGKPDGTEVRTFIVDDMLDGLDLPMKKRLFAAFESKPGMQLITTAHRLGSAKGANIIRL